MTPEMERGRHTHFGLLGEALPPLSAQDKVLEAEFNCLVNVLNHFGFPSLESVRLQENTLIFLQQWGKSLDARVKQVQEVNLVTQSALLLALRVHQNLGKTYPAAQAHPGYQQIHGALQVLEKLAQSEHCPWERIRDRVPALHRGMDAVLKEVKWAVT